VNPFKTINNLYTPSKTKLYHNNHSYELPPHIYSVASEAYHNIVQMKQDQSIIISGESGAGKTESVKQIMHFLAAVSGGDEKSNSKQQILQSVPILEAFGNAKTLTNNNSSRFGKYMEIYFNWSGEMVGGKITHCKLQFHLWTILTISKLY
jgi:myosin heavy subunit